MLGGSRGCAGWEIRESSTARPIVAPTERLTMMRIVIGLEGNSSRDSAHLAYVDPDGKRREMVLGRGVLAARSA